jgi:ABC-type phosphate transport system substrate-binding protein
MKKRAFIGFVVGSLVAAVAGASLPEPGSSFKVIVNSKVGSARAVPKDVLAQIYLGQANRWGNGAAIAAVDLSTTSPVRKAFSEQVLGMPVEAVKNHWLKKLVAGSRPLLSKGTEDEVIAFVASQPGGVGYVSSATALPPTVSEIAIQ